MDDNKSMILKHDNICINSEIHCLPLFSSFKQPKTLLHMYTRKYINVLMNVEREIYVG